MKKQTFIVGMRSGTALLAVCGILLFSQCAKDKSDDAPASKRALLIGKKWKMTAFTINPGIEMEDQVITDIYKEFLPACMKDDFIEFRADGKVMLDEGASKCNDEDPQTETHNWNMNDDGSGFSSDLDNGVEGTVKLVSLSANSFALEYKGKIEGDPVERTATATYTSF